MVTLPLTILLKAMSPTYLVELILLTILLMSSLAKGSILTVELGTLGGALDVADVVINPRPLVHNTHTNVRTAVAFLIFLMI
jgi:hypothetical protein